MNITFQDGSSERDMLLSFADFIVEVTTTDGKYRDAAFLGVEWDDDSGDNLLLFEGWDATQVEHDGLTGELFSIRQGDVKRFHVY